MTKKYRFRKIRISNRVYKRVRIGFKILLSFKKKIETPGFSRGVIKITKTVFKGKTIGFNFKFKPRKYKPFNWRSNLPIGQKTWKPGVTV